MSTSPSTPAPASKPDIASRLEAFTKRFEAVEQKLDAIDKSTAEARKGAPFIRKGESVLSSRGFQFSRLCGVLTEKLNPEQAKVEVKLVQRLQNEYVARRGSCYYEKSEKGSVVVPFSTDLMMEADTSFEKFAGEVREIVTAGVSGADQDEMISIMRKHYGPRQKTLSWQDAGHLAEVVPPPVFGEPIELLRNKEVFLAAGARLIPFPASGRAVWPRFTGASTAQWLGSGANDRAITESEPTSGDLVLQVKKLGVVVQIPNELFRFPSVSVEAIIRADMMMQAALKMDKAFIDGVGSQTQPKGIVNYDNIVRYQTSTAPTPAGLGTDGNHVSPEDILQIIAAIEENNVDFGAWIGRAKMYAGLANKRADAATPGDKQGMFLFNMLRDGTSSTVDVTQPSKGSLEGYPFYKSNQVAKDRVKGASTNLTQLIFGQFQMYMIAMSGVMEFAVATQGDIFRSDQSEIRLITWCDGAPRYEEAFGTFDYLYQSA